VSLATESYERQKAAVLRLLCHYYPWGIESSGITTYLRFPHAQRTSGILRFLRGRGLAETDGNKTWWATEAAVTALEVLEAP
jgi:hypothetical protein